MPGTESGTDLPAFPRRRGEPSGSVFSCADLTESFMSVYAASLGLDVISTVVLAVLQESRDESLPNELALTDRCVRRLDLLRTAALASAAAPNSPPEWHDPRDLVGPTVD